MAVAVASWMLRNRNIRSSRYNRSRLDNDEIKVDFNRDPQENAKEILLGICNQSDISEGKRISYLNNFVKLILQVENNVAKLSYSVEDILLCLRVALVSDSTQVRSAGLRAIRHVLSTEDDVKNFNKLLIPFFVARSLDLALKNDIERIQALRLMRKVLMLSASSFDIAMARSLVSLANGGVEEKDRMLRACLATLSELGVLNSELFILSGGVAAITRNLLECQTPRIAESLCGVLLLLLDRPITRNHAAVDLHCIAAPYCDFHYRHGWMDKNRDERELRFNCSRLALLSVLRSWPGILHFCSPSNSLGLKAIVDVLYLNQLEVRKAVLDLLYELLGLPQPEWTDELSVALSAIDPAEPQAAWRLNEGFVAAEGRSVLPHLARTTPSISDMHLSLLLYCFLETGLLCALAEVIATSDTFISVRATVLLGELLRMIQILLPPECCDITPALPNLLEYATKKPQALGAVTALQQLHKLLKRRPASSSLYLDYILRSGNFMKSPRSMEQSKKYKLSHTKSKLQQLVMKDGELVIRDTRVLISKDAFTWNWNLIKVILKDETDFELDITESTHFTFLKRLVEFFKPSNNRYSHMDLTSLKNSQSYTMVGIELIHCLVRLENSEASRLLMDLFDDISHHIGAITASKSAHDCLFSPQHMLNTQCQSYFLFVGRLGSTGIDLPVRNKIFKQIQNLATTTNHDYYVKLIVSSLDYREAGSARDLLTAVLKCPVESSRLYATQFLQVLLRAGLPQFSNWGIRLLASQLEDKSRTVCLTALAALHEACEVPTCLEQLVKLNPNVLHLGEKGVLLIIRFLSTPHGFNVFKKNGFVINEIKRWDEFFNSRYVRLVEGETSDALTLHQRGEDGHYDKRLSSLKVTCRKDLFVPPHIYGQLTKHTEGFQTLMEYGSIDNYIHCIENGLCETEQDIMNLKVALWTVGHLGSSPKGAEYLNSKGVIACMVRLAQHCVVYSVRATAYYTIGLIATSRLGADCLFKLGWVCTRHDRHNRWPVIEEENWAEENFEEPPVSAHIGSDSEYTSSDQAFLPDYYPSIPDADSTTTEEDLLCGYGTSNPLNTHQKSSTLPVNQNLITVHKRSLSESKTFDVLKGHELRSQEKVDFKLGADIPHRYRDNSVTDSTTSGVGSCESELGKSGFNERVQTLSPIPSSSSLSTLKTSGIRLRRHSESARMGSLRSNTPSDRSTVSPAGSYTSSRMSHQDLAGLAVLRSLRSSRIHQHNYFPDEDLTDTLLPVSLQNNNRSSKPPKTLINLDSQPYTGYYADLKTRSLRKNYLDNMSLTSLSSVQRFSVKDETKNKEQCYMGICLPRRLTELFPDEQVMARRLSFAEKNILEGSVSSSTDEMHHFPRSKKTRLSRHDPWTCLNCSRIRQKQLKKSGDDDSAISSRDSNLAVGDSYASSTDLQKDSSEIKEDILKLVERLANPIWIKQARQGLLHHKQRNTQVYQDVCLYSEVCKLVSESTYRLAPRRLIQELFLDVSFDIFYYDAENVLSHNKEIGQVSEVERPSSTLHNNYSTDKNTYLTLVAEQRKAELLSSNRGMVIASQSNKRIYSGFNIEKTSGDENERLSPIKFEPRSPPLTSVKEENLSSVENLLASSDTCIDRRSNVSKTDVNSKSVVLPTIKTLDSLNLSYSQNKFPIKRSQSENVTN